VSRYEAWRDERGFTLIEVMVTIIIMGIVFAIASSAWFGFVESRRVDSATNQVVADLRLAHAQATNRLTDTAFVAPAVSSPADPSTYQVGPTGAPETMALPSSDQGTPTTKILGATNIIFKPSGGATTPAGGAPGDITVASIDGDPSHVIRINPITSRVQVVS
jgi:prepilin-type N-terminal cleavage/methylation domain-containing protein